MKVYKAYYFEMDEDGETTPEMCEVYHGDSLEQAEKVADRWENRGHCVEIWYGDGGPDDELIDR